MIFYSPTKTAKAMAIGWKAKLDQFDLYGTLIFLPMIVCLLLALQWGGSKYPWHNGRIIALLVIFAVLLICFSAIQVWKKDNATVPLRILKQRSVGAAAWFGATLGAAFFIFVYVSLHLRCPHTDAIADAVHSTYLSGSRPSRVFLQWSPASGTFQ